MAYARGTVLLFLHADTRLPADAISVIQSMDFEKNYWASFDVEFDQNSLVLSIVSMMMNVRSRWSSGESWSGGYLPPVGMPSRSAIRGTAV